MDTDGYVVKNCPTLQFYTTSKKLADDFIFLVQSLGSTPTLGVKKNPSYVYKGQKKYGKDCYTITFSLPNNIEPFRVNHKEYYPPTKYPPTRLIDRIEKYESKEVVCISVAAKDGLYVTENCIVTHNTIISLTLLSYYFQLNKLTKALVLVPMDEAIDSWLDECNKWNIDLPVIGLKGSGSKKLEDWNNFDYGIGIGTYIGISTALSNLQLNNYKSRKKQKYVQQWVPNQEKIRHFSEGLNAIVNDESTKLSYHNTLAFKVISKLAEKCYLRYDLAGRPFGNNPETLWSQFYLIDEGETLGPTLGLYREAFFNARRSYWGGPFNFEYKLDPTKKKLLTDILQHRSISYQADECLDLPKCVKIVKAVNMSDNAREKSKELVKRIIDAKKNIVQMKNVFTEFRQLSSGFISLKDDEEGDKFELELEHNPKFELLMDLLEQLPEEDKAVIFYEFTYSGRKISQALTNKKLQHGWLWGGMKENWDTIKKKFDKNKKFRFLVVQNKKGSYALNLQAANIAIFYESPVSCIDREQAEKRVYRQGQKKNVIIYDLITRYTMDQGILNSHTEGNDLFKTLIVDPSKLLED